MPFKPKSPKIQGEKQKEQLFIFRKIQPKVVFYSRWAFCLRVSGPSLAATKIMAASVAKSFEFVSLSVSFIFLALRVDGVKRLRNSWAVYGKKSQQSTFK